MEVHLKLVAANWNVVPLKQMVKFCSFHDGRTNFYDVQRTGGQSIGRVSSKS